MSILGAPAEETFGGKIDLIEAGAFRDINAAIMAHPFPLNLHMPIKFALDM